MAQPKVVGEDTNHGPKDYLTGMSIGKDAGPIMMKNIESLAKEK